MAINKLNQMLQDTYGLDMNHSVIEKINLDFKNLVLSLVVKHYQDAGDYVAEKASIFRHEYSFNVAQLPASVITDAVSLKATVETELIANHPDYQGGTRVKDDGSPV